MEQVASDLLELVFRVDSLTVDLINELRTPVATKLMTSVTGMGSASAALVFLGLSYLAGWREEFLVTLVALSIAGIVVGSLMLTVQRAFPPQPVCMTGGAETVAHSFPSGHAAAVATYAMTARKSDVLPFGIVAAVAVTIAFSRIYLGTHYLSDTVAGVVIGVVAYLAAERVLDRLRSNEAIGQVLSRLV
jgi:undecaprenyl-diphosphatase